MNYLFLLLMPLTWFVLGGMWCVVLEKSDRIGNDFLAGGLFMFGFITFALGSVAIIPVSIWLTGLFN